MTEAAAISSRCPGQTTIFAAEKPFIGAICASSAR